MGDTATGTLALLKNDKDLTRSEHDSSLPLHAPSTFYLKTSA